MWLIVESGSDGEPLAVLHLLDDVEAELREDRIARRARRLTPGLDRTGPRARGPLGSWKAWPS